MDKRLLERFLKADDTVKALEKQLDDAKKKRTQADERLRAAFERDGVANIKATDGRTVYLQRQLWARAKDGNRVAVTEALVTVGLDDLVQPGFNVNQLSAYVRELDAAGEVVPPALADVIDVTETFALRVRKS